MMVPRAFLYSAPTSTNTHSDSESQVMNTPMEEHKRSKKTGRKEMPKPSPMLPKMFTPPPPTPSKPVLIPTRSRDGGRRKSRESVVMDKKQNTQVPHDHSSTPPSMAALLAMATQPLLESQNQPGLQRNSSSLASRKIQNARLRNAPGRSISSSSPQSWSVLLSPPEVSELEIGSLESGTTLGLSSSIRSLSTESMLSLETDTESLGSTSNPGTPAFISGNRVGSDRRYKSVSTSVGEDCALDHPLLHAAPHAVLEDEAQDEPNDLLPPTPSPIARSKSYFKSNLTASFRKIRSAAQSFSAFTATPTQREDYLARTILSMDPPFTDERRPLPSIDPPDPALRRYLNPIIFSPAELHFHSEESPQVARSSCTASIQLQTYRGQNRASDKASSPPVFASAQQEALDAVDGLPQPSSPRQREPRENSDFLRVIVLEMNMRKQGKLGDASPGRARLWLPARQTGKMTEESGMGSGSRGESEGGGVNKIPIRWMGVAA